MNAYSFLRRTVIVLLIASSPCLHAASIPTLFNTGVDDSGTLLGENQLDPHYKVTLSADPGFPGPDAFTLLPGFPVGPWIAEGPNSQWIAPQASQATGNAPGIYTLQTAFDLTGFDPLTAQITGSVSADNSVTAVRLNGSDLGITAGGFDMFHPLTIPLGSPFFAGTNTLEFDVSNAGDVANPIGFRAEMTGRATGSNESPSVVTPPQSQTVIVGDIVTFTVDADGTPPLSYQWRLQSNSIAGTTTNSYTITGVNTNHIGEYTVVITNSFGSVTSVVATLSVLVPFPGIYNTGMSDNREVLADGLVDPHYKLVVNPNDPASGDSVVHDSTVFPIVLGPWIQNSVKSKWIGPVIDTIAAVDGGYSYQLNLDLTGYDPSTAFIAGSWATDNAGSIFLNGADTGFRSADFTAFSVFTITNGFVSGTNGLEFRVNNAGAGYTGLRVENLRGTAERGTVTQLLPRVVTQPQDATRVITTEVAFTVVADGTQPLSYQWSHNDTPLADRTNTSLFLSPVLTTNAGAYTVRVSNALGSTNSEVAQLVVVQPQLGVFNTGVDNIGAALASGQSDPHYVLISSADPAYPGPTAYAPTTAPIPPWVAEDGDSRWITPRPDASEVVPGIFRYRLIFSIDNSNEVATAAITANVGTDDGNGGVFLNGNDVSFGASGFGSLTALNIPDGTGFFVAGLNTLDFVVSNGGAAANPSGLRVDDVAFTGVTLPPALIVSPAGGGIQVAWLTNAVGFVLQETSVLPGSWTNSSASVAVQGNQNVATITPGGGAKFYRLLR
jgi:hypothetical protein